VKVLVTGGAGYIGSTIASACLDAGITPVILDDLSTGRVEFTRGRTFYRGDIGDGTLVDRVFADHPDIETVVHCAARVVAPESARVPLDYYRTNVASSIELIGRAVAHGCRRFVLSSSAAAADPTSPYGHSKAMVERVLADCAHAGLLTAVALRYHNVIGADPGGWSGPTVQDPTHVLGRLIAAQRDNTPFIITGTDWPTRDGTGIRDYVHVWDVARAHVELLNRFGLVIRPAETYRTIGLGSGRGTTVRELHAAFEAVTGRAVPCRDAGPRPGDRAVSTCHDWQAWMLLRWQPRLSLADGIRDALAWADRRVWV
jgi:UDP-glucose 4-epimerase